MRECNPDAGQGQQTGFKKHARANTQPGTKFPESNTDAERRPSMGRDLESDTDIERRNRQPGYDTESDIEVERRTSTGKDLVSNIDAERNTDRQTGSQDTTPSRT